MSRSLVLRGGRVGFAGPRADVVVHDGVVAAIDAPVLDVPRDATVVDLPDATVLPGLVDSHVHLDQWAHRQRRVDVSHAASPSDVISILTAHHGRGGTSSEQKVLTGHGFVDGLWTHPPHRVLLDRAFPELPVAVVSSDLHAVWLNGPALALLGMRDHPSGVLREKDCMDTMRHLMAIESTEVVDAWVADSLDAAAARGLTGIVDFEYADNVTTWQRRAGVRRPTVRIHTSIWLPWLEDAISAGLTTGRVLDGTGGRVHVGPFKLMADGSLNTRTAYCHDPYPAARPGEEYGLDLIPPAELVDLMARASGAGFELAVHAIGDAANSRALDGFEKVGCAGRIEHAQLVRESDVQRFAAAGVIASIQPQHAVADRDVAELHWHGRTGQAFAYRSLHEAGAELRLGSDAPVSQPDPWLAIADAVARTDNDREAWHPEQALPLEVAVRAAADGRRTVAEGSRADLTVVAGDVATMGPDELRDVHVLATIVGGEVVHRNA